MTVREIKDTDIKACLDIYNYYITDTLYTFETEKLSLETFKKRVDEIKKDYPYFVCEENGEILGYCYLNRYKPRGAYYPTCEISIYVKNGSTHKGIGSLLLKSVEAAAFGKYENIISAVSDVNSACNLFHLKHGYSFLAAFPNIARKFGTSLGLTYYIKRL